MNTKNSILSIFLSIFAISLIAQNTKKEQKADKLYNDYFYSAAINKYLSISDKNVNVKRNLAESYFNLSKFEKAQEWYKDIVNTEGHIPNDVYRYAYMLRINENYAESEQWLSKYYELNSSDSRVIQAKMKMNSFSELQKDKRQFEIKNLKMNGPAEDFSPSFYKDEIVFASSKNKSNVVKREWNGNNYPYLNFYKGSKEEDFELKNIKPFESSKNKKWHEGPVTFNKEGTFMVFTRNNYKSTSSEGTRKLMLFSSELKDGKWTEGEALPFNSPEYSVGQASLSADGNTIYFASDMPGGFGGTDIYKATRQNDNWSDPVNLGASVNTEGREMFPFIDSKEKLLFFASDGHYGLGGLDLFMSSVNGNSLGTARNLGAPVNGSYDDFALIVDADYKNGYFSSNRLAGEGDDDIYSVKILKPFGKSVNGLITDINGERIENAEVSLVNKNGEIVETVFTGSDGNYEFFVSDNDVYAIEVAKEGYTTSDASVNLNTTDDEVVNDVVLKLAQDFVVYSFIYDEATSKGLAGVQAKVSACDGSWSETFTSSENGDFSQALNNRLNDNVCLMVEYYKEGYDFKQVNYDFSLDHKGQYNINETLQKSSNTLVSNVGSNNNPFSTNVNGGGSSNGFNNNSVNNGQTTINPIYFDVNSYNIRPDAKVELDKIVSLMTKYPNLSIEVSAHTDCRASRKFNQILSANRAKASLRYIKSRISNPSRIYGEGYGESRLVNNCVCEPTNDSNCSDDQHQQNRRTEFVIISQ